MLLYKIETFIYKYVYSMFIMTQILTISIADDVYELIKERMTVENKNNRSEFVESMIRSGLQLTESKKRNKDNEKKRIL